MPKPSRRRPRPLAIEPIEPRRLLAFAAELVADVDDSIRSPPTYPSNITEFNGSIVYSGRNAATGDELWQSDGTKAGTRLIRDIAAGTGSSRPQELINVSGTLFFTAETLSRGRELWKSDGTAAGTYLLKDIAPGKESSLPVNLTNVNGRLFFRANDGTHGSELWTSDGTAPGTRMVKDVLTGEQGAFPGQLTSSQGRLFFESYQGDFSHVGLSVSDGTAAGTRALALPEGTTVSEIAGDVSGVLYFEAENAETGRELWRTDGTDEGTQLVIDLRPGPGNGIGDQGSSQFLNVGGTLFFRGNDGVHGYDLWKTDGTAAGATLVKDLPDAINSGYGPLGLFNANGTLYFVHDRVQLWRSDGTSAGTKQLYDFTPGNGVGGLYYIDDTLYFAADGGDGVEFWKSDGTPSGTLEVKDIYPGVYHDYYFGDRQLSSYPGSFYKLDDTIVFAASDVNGGHLWTTDGTANGTRLMDDLEHITTSSRVQQLFNFNGRLIFSAEEAYSGEIGTKFSTWISDGTRGGTVELAESLGKNFANINGTVYFSGSARLNDSSVGRELWRTDGTKEGTIFVTDINSGFAYGTYDSDPSWFTAIDGRVVFASGSRLNRRELWITDGTAEGSHEVKDINPEGGSYPSQFVRFGEYVYFTAHEPTHDTELWRTDGTAAGTQLVKDIDVRIRESGKTSIGPENLLVFHNKLYFTADDGLHGRDLWQSDGTASGTVMVRDLIVGSKTARTANLTLVNDQLLFTTYSSGKMTLWKSDGTSQGTQFVAFIPPSQEFAAVNDTLYFAGTGPEGTELWRSDGTAAGTRIVEDLIPGEKSSTPKNLQAINGVLFFEADLPGGGRGHWISNGTANGTHPLYTGAPLTAQGELTNVNGTLYFAGTDVVHGQELWKFTTAHPSIAFSGTLNYRENEPLRLIVPGAALSDADNVRFTGGRMTVAIDRNAGVSDHIEIRHQGDGPGQIGVAPRWIRFGGVTIGSYHYGNNRADLIIDLNANATVAATQALLRNIGYRNDSDNPSTNPRRVTVTLTDGSGGISVPISKTINVVATNDAPRLVLGGQIAYKNNTAPILLAAAASVSDADSTNFAGGLLTVAITSGGGAGNRLWVSGAYSLQGNRLLRNGILMGTVVENGNGWNDLKLRFNTNMTAPLVQELVRSLRFRTVNNTNLSPRTIEFTLTDGDGGVSAKQTKRVNLTA